MTETLVLYHIPSDHDEAEVPNAFIIPKHFESISLADLHDHFPLPGEYHFRLKHGNNFWLDLRPGQAAPLPMVTKSRIVLKALRISWHRASHPRVNAPAAPVTAAITATAAVPAPQTVDSFDAFFS